MLIINIPNMTNEKSSISSELELIIPIKITTKNMDKI